MNPNPAVRQPGILAALLIVAALFLLGSGAVFLLSGHGPQAASGAPVAALYGLAIDAKAAATGDQQALARFQQSEKALEDADSRNSGASFTNDARFTRLTGDAGTIQHSSATLVDASSALNDIQAALPHLTDEATALAALAPSPAAATVLEHFQARAAQLQVEARKLIHGGADAQTPQRLGEASDDLGAAPAGLRGLGRHGRHSPERTGRGGPSQDTRWSLRAAGAGGEAPGGSRRDLECGPERCPCHRHRCSGARGARARGEPGRLGTRFPLARPGTPGGGPVLPARRALHGCEHAAGRRAAAGELGCAEEGDRPEPAGDPQAAR